MTRRRLDAELVRRGLFASRESAKAAIEAGSVRVSGAVASKAARQTDASEPIEIDGPAAPYVSRGGVKLAAALDRFEIDVTGWRVVDAGASTGGFTDCLVQRGAAEVVAVDVGRGQLHERLRRDPRVRVIDGVNVRGIDPSTVGGPVPLVVADLSFISLRTVLAALLGLLEPGGRLVALIKPQFEAGRAEVGRGRGVIRDPAVWRRVIAEVRSDARDRGATMMDIVVSPVTGAAGNVEFLALIAPGARREVDESAVEAALDVAAGRGGGS